MYNSTQIECTCCIWRTTCTKLWWFISSACETIHTTNINVPYNCFRRMDQCSLTQQFFCHNSRRRQMEPSSYWKWRVVTLKYRDPPQCLRLHGCKICLTLWVSNWITPYGIPTHVLTDNRTQFVCNFVEVQFVPFGTNPTATMMCHAQVSR